MYAIRSYYEVLVAAEQPGAGHRLEGVADGAGDGEGDGRAGPEVGGQHAHGHRRPEAQPEAQQHGYPETAGGPQHRITSYNVCYTKLLRY